MFNNEENNRPLFSNEFNNINNSVNQENNYSNANQNMGPLFSNNDQNNVISPENDIPPEIGEIKNLSETTNFSAPTMDVLGPMNIMPETLPVENNYETKNNNNDLLESYDQGLINNNPVNSLEQQNLVNFETNENNYNIQTNDNQNLYNNISPDEFQNISTNSSDISLNSSQSEIKAPDLNDILKEVKAPELDNLPYEMSLNNEKEQVSNLPALEEIKSLSNENNYEINQDIKLEETSKEYEIVQKNISEQEKEEQNYEILQESIQENQNLTDLGLQDNYIENDFLEIMDLEPEEEQKTTEEIKEPKEDNEHQISITDAVLKIKKLIGELKILGINIEMEEFDFESLYQIVVKLKK